MKIEDVLNLESKILVDLRDVSFYDRDHIEGAIHLSEFDLLSLPKNQKIIIYNYTGFQSELICMKYQSLGYDIDFIDGGYYGYIDYIDPSMNIERSLIKKFRKDIWRKFTKAVTEYDLISNGDKIAVCISGGKDSFLLAKCFQEIKKHGMIDFDLEFIVMNPGYNLVNVNMIEENAKRLNIPIHIFSTDIFEYVSTQSGSPCYLCARMRRGHLYNAAKELGCNKIALGHHYDDVIETILMGMLYGAQIQTMMPKLHSTNFEGMELIRPLYLVREESIIHWMDYHHLQFLRCACKLTEMSEEIEGLSKRKEVKQLISNLHKINPYVEANIFKSVENVNLDTVIAYKKEGQKIHFLDHYKEET
ncbi:ATP-binding protein [Floccifex sp.]|uniref:ATP-binding protein n=1 Tax=Floccifex sp. TaxID=2815810 RepID=UPI003F04310B